MISGNRLESPTLTVSYVRNSVNEHCSHKAGIVNLMSLHRKANDELFPFRVYRRRVREKAKKKEGS